MLIADLFEKIKQDMEASPQTWALCGTSLRVTVRGVRGGSLVIRAAENPEVVLGEAHFDCELELSEDDLTRMLLGKLNPQRAVLEGRIKAAGEIDALLRSNLVLEKLGEFA